MSENAPEVRFDELGLDPKVLKALKDVGYESPSPIQAETIPLLLDGHHVVGLAQTGTGKTAAFALPILSRIDTSDPTPQALVLAPTRELALQVSEAFERYEDALVANRVEELVEWFDVSERTVRYGIDENLHGFDEIAEYRRTQAIATPPRTLRNTVITTYGDSFATADTEFLPTGSDAVGRQSQTWIRTAAGWRVASAHVSWLSGRRPG